MNRPDLTNDLVHFIRGETFADAFETLKKILSDKFFLGGTGFIRGGHRCVCFSEAPVSYLGYALTQPSTGVRYQPAGILVYKRWLYSLGGRPVIYQRDAEYEHLPEGHRWRHVRYEPDADPPIDFTWEREWRIRTQLLDINPSTARVVLPTQEVSDRLHAHHEQEQDSREQQYAIIFDEIIAWQLREDFPWTIVTIDSL